MGSNVRTPAKVATNAVAIAAGHYHTLYVTTTCDLYAMGGNSYGQLGDSSTADRPTPVKVATNVGAIAGSWAHSMYTTMSGDLYTMGDNQYGQLGDSSKIGRLTPVKIASGLPTGNMC